MGEQRVIGPEEFKLGMYRAIRTAERNALVKRLFPEGIDPYEQEKVVARIRRYFPELSRNELYRMNPGQLVVYLKEVTAIQRMQVAPHRGHVP